LTLLLPLRAMKRLYVAVLMGACLTWTSAAAQAPAPPPQTPPARTQAPARAPQYTPKKLPFGQPDLQGVWKAWNTAAYDIEDHSASLGVPAGKGVIVDPPDGKLPYKPEMLAKRRQNLEASRTSDILKSADPLAKCYMPGVPRITYLGWPFQIFQTPKYVAILYEWTHVWRLIYLDRKEHDEGISSYQGDSIGHWEGATLVADVKGFNDFTWFDKAGNFHSDQLHVVERYTPIDADTLRYEATIDDPQTFTRPWTMRMDLRRQKDIGLLDYECFMMLDESGIPLTWPRTD
jgi:hypothetical protein